MSNLPDNPRDHESRDTRPAGSAGERHDESRRRLIRGAAAAPIIFTLASRPAWGGVCTISVMASDNLSHPGRTDNCNGNTPGYWKQHPEMWPAPYEPGSSEGDDKQKVGISASGSQQYAGDGTKFQHVFGMAHPTGHDKTMMQVMQLNGNEDPYELGAHAVAAVLNAAYWGAELYGYTPDEIVHMYNMRYYEDPQALKYDLEMLNIRSAS
ncbi:hypothetical protein EDC23_0165 [Thiohalophilus thiocyanatoxydans]|uniref:Uncharacterized protein n=1 Tax=Thiohalophilus thiocyanatoxydans TaxID=381308 RepID=A0A4V6QBZ0_9GAMM|nr:hypothetical protein [Thiohalophilus thiocyanatoxydans]TDY03795.1 hypothetical protein EDC23_0165 [Thiohalophilus thiocyanatoxydans]